MAGRPGELAEPLFCKKPLKEMQISLPGRGLRFLKCIFAGLPGFYAMCCLAAANLQLLRKYFHGGILRRILYLTE